MARIRTIKPEFWINEQVLNCSIPARLLFIGMWNFCDDDGVYPVSYFKLKHLIYAAENFTIEDIKIMIDELKANDLLEEFNWENKAYWQVTGWHKNQVINNPSKVRHIKGYPQLRYGSRMEREREKDNINTTVGSSLGDYPQKFLPPVDIHTDVVLKIPLSNGGHTEIKQYQIDQWANLFPGIDVLDEITKIKNWYEKNPKKQKRLSDVIDHLMNCLRKAKPNPYKLEEQKLKRQSKIINFNEIIEKKMLKAV